MLREIPKGCRSAEGKAGGEWRVPSAPDGCIFPDCIREGVNNGSRDRRSQVKWKWLLRPLEGIGDLAKGLPEFISFFPRLSALFLLFPPLVPVEGRGTEIASKGQHWA